jgi:hypothetical protein
MVETAIFSQWQHNDPSQQPLHYARWNNGEVDIVYLDHDQKPIWCVEIKWSNKFADKPYELKHIKSFCTKHKSVDSITITTINITKDIDLENLSYKFVPASLYCYTVGRNIVESKSRKVKTK